MYQKNYQSEQLSFQRALNLLKAGKYEKATLQFKRLSKEFEYKEIYLNLGNCYKLQRMYDKAKECYIKANDPRVPFTDNTFIKGDYDKALNNLGLVHFAKADDVTAEQLYRKALAIDPFYVDAIWNLGNTLLRKFSSRNLDDPTPAWGMYEYRFKREEGGVYLKSRRQDLIAWKGEPVNSLVIMTEQGFGDYLMFGRFIQEIKNVNKIWIQCHDKLKPIFSGYRVCNDPDETDATHAIPICSLGGIFQPSTGNPEWLKDRYVRKTPDSNFDIGVVWSGSDTHVNNLNRNTTPGYFKRLSRFGNLHTLNPSEAGTKGFTHLESTTWLDTLNNLSKLDLVITVDTAIVHLCGSVGMECWNLLPKAETDFRWGNNSMGYENIWYPSVKIIRNPGDWDKVFTHVERLLEERVNNK